MEIENTNNNFNAQPFVTLPTINNVCLKNLQVCFCIDVSGSTASIFADQKTILDVETEFVKSFLPELTKPPKFISWDDKSQNILNVDSLKPDAGTRPACLFQNSDTLGTIKETDVAIIITDGCIGIEEINAFGKYMTSLGTHLKAVVGVIVGRRTNCRSGALNKPADIGVSVLVPAMISNSCILFHNWNTSYVMWSSGIFKPEWKPNDITNESNWSHVTNVDISNIININIPIVNPVMENELCNKDYIPFGCGIFFNPNNLLLSCPSWDDLLEMPFDRICQYFKVTLRYAELLKWFKVQKDKFLQEFVTVSDEKEKIDLLIKEMLDRGRSVDHNIVTSFINTRNNALTRRYIDDVDIENVSNDPRIAKLLQFFRQMIKIMEEDNHIQYESSCYTSFSISSSRYCTSNPTNTPTNSKSSKMTADFNEPLKWLEQFSRLYPLHNSLKCECSICVETSIPFIIIRKHIGKNYINDIVDYPTSYFYPQLLCCKCATYFCNIGIDPVRVSCFAAIPIVRLVDDSQIYYLTSFMKLINYNFKLNKNSFSRNESSTKNSDDFHLKLFLSIVSLFYEVIFEHLAFLPEINSLSNQLPGFKVLEEYINN